MGLQMTVRLKAAYREDPVATGFVSYCPALKIYAHGDSADASIDAMEKTLQLYLGTCLQRGILNDVLEKAGFEVVPEAVHQAMTVADAECEFIAIQELNFKHTFEVEVQIPFIHKLAMKGQKIEQHA
jgi:hypothetical protein